MNISLLYNEEELNELLLINNDNSINNDIDVILVSGAEDSISNEQIINLEEYINQGGNIFIAQNRIKTDLTTQTADPIQSNIFSF